MEKTVCVAIAVAVAGAGCGGKKGSATCAGAAAKIAEISSAELKAAQVSPDVRAKAATQLAPLRDAAMASCGKLKWSEATRRCVIAAASGVAVTACLTPDPSPTEKPL